MEQESSSSGIVQNEFLTAEDTLTSYSELACSGFNRIFKIKRSGKWFLLKGLKQEFRNNPTYLELLKKEFALTSQLDHPNIVKAIAKENDVRIGPAILMEYIDGDTLDVFLKKNPSKDIRKKVITELLDALQYIHSKQTIHRDIKPSNILITHNGSNVKIIDFGLSDADGYAILKQAAGTKKYAAPEQLVAPKEVDCRTDIFAFGKMLQLVSPKKYTAIAKRCTQTDREKRYDNIEQIQKAIVRRERFPYIVLGVFLAILALLPSAVLVYEKNFVEPTLVHMVDTIVIEQKDTVWVEKTTSEYASQEQILIDKTTSWIREQLLPATQAIKNGEIKYYEIAHAQVFPFFKSVQNYCNEVSKTLEENSLFYHQFYNAVSIVQSETMNKYLQYVNRLPKAHDVYTQGQITEEEYQQVLTLQKSLAEQ